MVAEFGVRGIFFEGDGLDVDHMKFVAIGWDDEDSDVASHH